MPYIPENLYTKTHHDGWRPGWPTVLNLSTHLAEAVAAVHSAGILHRDLKPGNVLLDQKGLPHICDFGIAMPIADLQIDDAGGITKGKPSGGFKKRNMMGTLEYMAPETLQKQLPSQKSDVWALAVMLNEVATGTFPYSDCTQENPAAHTVLEMGYGRCVNHSSSATHETAYLKASVSTPRLQHIGIARVKPQHMPNSDQGGLIDRALETLHCWQLQDSACHTCCAHHIADNCQPHSQLCSCP